MTNEANVQKRQGETFSTALPLRWLVWATVAAVALAVAGYAVFLHAFSGQSSLSVPLRPAQTVAAASPAAFNAARPAAGLAAEKKPDSPPAATPYLANKPIEGDSANEPIEIGIAYGTEKQTWLEWATKEFAHSDDGRAIRVNLIPMGSIEGAHAVLDGDAHIQVWSPAARIYRETFERDWAAKWGPKWKEKPIVKEELLALTPLVLVMWKTRYEAFIVKSPTVSLWTIDCAMRAKTGWGAIAGRPEWGHFKFGHTHPNQSNSGLSTLILLAYEFLQKKSGLTVEDIMSQGLQDRLSEFESGVSGLSHSTGDMMKEMVLKGPTSYDGLMVYESVAIDYLAKAEGRWDQLQVIYPKYSLWCDNPYYILNTPWTTPAQRRAAATFLAFLMSAPIQARALDHGFRPGNPEVPVRGERSPFTRYAKNGLSVELPEMCAVPSAEVIENLTQSWKRHSAPR